MFYYPNVLHRHTGCFSTIWLAATRGIKVTRRELLKVNIGRTCEDIMDYVLVRVPPPNPNLPKPRFSLYLSSQLQYGVVVVYHRQCRFLLEDSQQIVERLLRPEPGSRIDVAEHTRGTLDMPDNLFLMEEAEGAQDPFFGLMRADQLPSPYKMQQVLTQDSQRSLVASPLIAPHGFRSPAAVITLREKEQLGISAAECFEGADLPEATAQDIDLLMDQQDQFCDVEEQERERAREASLDLEGARTSIDQLKETTVARPDTDRLWLLDEETGRPFAVPLATISTEMTPPSSAAAVAVPPAGSSGRGGGSERETERAAESSADGEAYAPPRRGRRGGGGGRRRQLVFADPEVQISDRAMAEQIETPLAEILSPAEVLVQVPSLNKAQLLSAPSSALYHPDLLSLWKQGAHLVTLPQSGHDGPAGEEEREEEIRGSEQDRETLRKERKGSLKEAVEPGFQLTDTSSVSDVFLDFSRGDKSHSDIITPASRWSPQGEVQDLMMQPIAEEHVEMPELLHTHTQSRDLSAPGLLRLASSLLQRFGQVTFDTLLPPEADRAATAHTLCSLLELVSVRELMVQQPGPYSTIIITQP